MKCLLILSNSPNSKHKAGFIVFHPERNNIISKFCPLNRYSWTIIAHLSDFGLIYVAPRTKRKLTKEPGYIYIIGGYDNTKKKFTRRILRYDLIRGEWFHCAKMSIRRADFTPFLYDGKIYLAGGQTSKTMITSTVEYYEPMLDLVYEASPLPSACSHYSCVSAKKQAFIIGGNVLQKNGIISTSSHIWCLQRVQEQVAEEPEICETVTTWCVVNGAEIPITGGIGGHRAVFCEENNRIYIIGGLYYTNIDDIIKKQSEDDHVNMLWFKRDIGEMQRSNCGVSIINNKIFVIGGVSNHLNTKFPITEINEDELTIPNSAHSQSTDIGPRLNQTEILPKVFPLRVNETISYYDWRRKICSDMFKLRHGDDMDLEGAYTVVVDMEEHYAEFKTDNYDWILQWPLW